MLTINNISKIDSPMNKDKVIEIFVSVDDFCNDLDHMALKRQLLGDSKKRRNRKSKLSLSEKMTIYICFHLSSYTNFKGYYTELVLVHWGDLFPDLISYQRFNNTQDRLFVPLVMYMNNRCLGKSTGISFVDSTTLNVCHIKREKQHKVFKGIAKNQKEQWAGIMGLNYT